MNINATIFGQMITFGIFVWINMKFIWPKIISVLNEREHKILCGLQAAEQGQQKLEKAALLAKATELETKKYCAQLIADAKKQADNILTAAISKAKQTSDDIIADAKLELTREHKKLQKELQAHTIKLIIKGAEKIICSAINEQQHAQILSEINNQIYDAE
jgi:F-type H+-transporting ATPase subunit b